MRQLRIRHIVRRARLLICAGFALVSAGCSTGTILASHEPMHPKGRPVTLKAVATGHVDRIEFRVQRFAINTDQLTAEDPKLHETELTPPLLIWICNPPFVVNSLKCSHQLAFSGNGQIVQFSARAVYWNGSSDEEVYRFASGDFPVTNAPIPIRMKREIGNGIDIVFVPHIEVVPESDPSAAGFRTHLDDIVDGILFEYPIIRDNRKYYNFWYSPIAVDFDAGNCTNLVDPYSIDLDFVADVSIYVHHQYKRNCSYGTRFTTEMWYGKSVVHELGHALAGLRDEYAVATEDFPPREEMPNTFRPKQACIDEAPLIGLSPDKCVLSTPGFDYWRIDPTGAEGCMMGPSQHLTWSDFGPACERRFNWRYTQCLEGDCIRPANPVETDEETPPEQNESRR